MLLVLLESNVVRSCAHYLRELATFSTPQQIHLPETIAGRHITLREIKVVIIFRLNVGNATFIAPYGYALAQTCHHQRSGRRLIASLLFGRNSHRPLRRQKEKGKEDQNSC